MYCYSANYIWNESDILGEGTYGKVYKGENKNTGEFVAVKTFRQKFAENDVYMRELDVLEKVNSEYIVKLLSIETDSFTGKVIIVMELCTGGSLLNLLQDPENSFGMPQTEFLLVLEHLCAGLKYLRDNNLIHRDLKPGNIMKFISEDGRTIYKLIDFGAARELEDNHTYNSIWGTEEYVHPDIYARALLPHSQIARSFSANIDLWSIGVTLYHVVTGDLPFRPFGGRTNRVTMYMMTTKKAAGVISAIQWSEKGEIEWSNTLPAHCHLSDGLKTLLTPLLAGLLEGDREKMWSFDRFFDEVTSILRKRLLHVFYVNRVSSIEIFIEPDQNIDQFRKHLFQQTEVSVDNQILIINNEQLSERFFAEKVDKWYSLTTKETPIFLYNSENVNINSIKELNLPKFPVFNNAKSTQEDTILAETICSVAHYYQRRIDIYTTNSVLIQKSVEEFIATLTKEIINLSKDFQSFRKFLSAVMDFAKELITTNDKDIKSLAIELDNLKKFSDSDYMGIKALVEEYVNKDELSTSWNQNHGQIFYTGVPSAQVRNIIGRLRTSCQRMRVFISKDYFSTVDGQFFTLEKVKIERNVEKIKSLLLNGLKPDVAQKIEFLSDWYKLGQTVYSKLQILEKMFQKYELGLIYKKLRRARKKIYSERECTEAQMKNMNLDITPLLDLSNEYAKKLDAI